MTVIDTIVDGYRDSLSAVPYGDDSTLISLPATFASGEMLSLLITVTAGLVNVTDRGQTADVLLDYGVDRTKGRAAASFDAVRRSVGLPPVFGSADWEITAAVDPSDVAIAVQAVADAAMRADGLRVLARDTRSASFADKSVRRISERTAVVPRARIPGRHGGQRPVTLSYPGKDGGDYFLQALASRDSETRLTAYDHASGLFMNAQPELSHRIALLEDGSWEPWQIKGLKSICRVVVEDEVDSLVQDTAAA
ncbi:hypothetical protein SEA_TORTELLINI_35 [Mycobacterium phage Tortellini]|uniref:DUF1828 domain-containing protein n=1 Tax=Mycobacterium phage Tortellini TaxID=1897497 RepID=A0A1D8EX15_9CAUD|nr:hypothetical protein FDH05_gp35 [Mycobacterium phage Tortellini]AOT25780.1 hypothetical protein SEA_TORTELLINI_35 [Mycobacterium phage Tortellini]